MEDQPYPSPPPPPLPPATPPPIIAPQTQPAPKGGRAWKIVAVIACVLLVLVLGFLFLTFSAARVLTGGHSGMAASDEDRLEEVVVEHNTGDKKIAVISVEGVISATAEDRSGINMVDSIAAQLKAAGKDDEVKAVILKVNSPGGEVLAADQINRALVKFQDEKKKPVIVSMGSLAASGGYYISAPCRWIVANELTITGSIGVIMHGYNYRLLMDKIGLQPDVFKSGKFKDMLSGEREPDDSKLTPEDRAIRAEERRLVQDLIDETFNRFKEVVRTGREDANTANHGDGRALISEWQNYADGRVFSGKEAYKLGFVDQVGDFDAAVKQAEKLAGVSKATLIEYHIPFDLGNLLRLFGKTEAPALKVDLGVDLPRLRPGLLYFITPTVLN